MENTGKPPVKDRIHLGHARPGGRGFSATKTKGSKGITASVSKTNKTGVCLQTAHPAPQASLEGPQGLLGFGGNPVSSSVCLGSRTHPVRHNH